MFRADESKQEAWPLFRAACARQDLSLDIAATLRKAITSAIKSSPKSRAQVAEEISRLTGKRVSENMLHTFTSESHEGHRFPAEWLPALCISTGDARVLHVIAEAAGYRLITNEEAMLIEYARSVLRRKQDEELIQRAERYFRGER